MENKIYGLTPVCTQESALIIGGIDNMAKQAMYHIGYVLGSALRQLASLRQKIGNIFKR